MSVAILQHTKKVQAVISHGKTKSIWPLYYKNVNVISITECYLIRKGIQSNTVDFPNKLEKNPQSTRHVQYEQEHTFLVV